jgi:nucleotide-binding universal stress UspA family protein
MQMIVVGIDGSPTAHRAAEIAATLAAATDASLHVVSAFHQKAAVDGGPEFGLISSADQAHALVARVAGELEAGSSTVTSDAIEGRPAEVVCAEAQRLGADLIVVGNKRVQGVARVLGAVANKVLQQSPCDVYVAHTSD